MNAIETVRAYLEVATPGPDLKPDRVRPLLADDYVVDDALMGAASADAFVAQLRQAAAASGPGVGHVEAVVGNDEVVAALTRFTMGEVTVLFSQWFWVRDGKLQRSKVIYDPRAFLAMQS